MSATGELVAFVRGLDARRLPDPVLRQAVRAVLDLIGSALAGAETPMGRIGARFARAHHAAGPATVIGAPASLTAVGATWANAISASALDLDDGHRLAMGHPGASVIPAALATAEAASASGRELLEAIVAGYEVAVRASAARVPAYKERQYSTGIWGGLGAAAATGRLLGLDAPALQSALGTAASHGPFPPAGPMANYSMTKEVIGWAAMTGCAAAFLAQDGFVGPADVFDYSGRWDTGELVDGLGDPVRSAILGVYFKPHAVCRWAHPAIDAMLELTARHAIEPGEIEAISVDGFYEMTRLLDYAPRTVVGAQFSLPFALAVAGRDRAVGLAQVTEAALTDPELLALARRVEVRVDPDLARAFPAKTSARVTLRTARGTYACAVEFPKGNPENPLTDVELADKFRSLAGPVIGDAAARALAASIQDLPAAPAVTSVTRHLACGPREEAHRDG
ncbi:MAG TPA: MmgE/PrpD family protein [Methylomirabilota bacterium]|nr:MmgE/PrpD family protein [Methylomirabilota bacterium]